MSDLTGYLIKYGIVKRIDFIRKKEKRIRIFNSAFISPSFVLSQKKRRGLIGTGAISECF